MGWAGITTQEQQINAGNNFNGTVPPGEITRADGIESFPPAITGGRFNFECLTRPHVVRSVELHLGGQTVWTVHKRDLQGKELLVLCGTDETDFITTEGDSFIMTTGQCLLVRTTGATAILFARVSVEAA